MPKKMLLPYEALAPTRRQISLASVSIDPTKSLARFAIASPSLFFPIYCSLNSHSFTIQLSYDQDGDRTVREDFHCGATQQDGRKCAPTMGTNHNEIAATIIRDIEDCSIGVLG